RRALRALCLELPDGPFLGGSHHPVRAGLFDFGVSGLSREEGRLLRGQAMNAGGRPGKTEERETMAETLKDLLAPHPAEWPAIGAPGRPWMTYGGLRDLSADVAASLRSNGIGAADRVAIVLPNGP